MKLLTIFLRGGPVEVELADQECARVLNLMRSPLGKEINCICANGDEVSFLAGHIDGHKVATVQPVKVPDGPHLTGGGGTAEPRGRMEAAEPRTPTAEEIKEFSEVIKAGVAANLSPVRKPNDRTKR